MFPLYNHISLTVDLPEMKGAKMMEKRRPDLIHVTSPYVFDDSCVVEKVLLLVPLGHMICSTIAFIPSCASIHLFAGDSCSLPDCFMPKL